MIAWTKKCPGTLSNPLAGSRASDRGEGMIVILAGGQGVVFSGVLWPAAK